MNYEEQLFNASWQRMITLQTLHHLYDLIEHQHQICIDNMNAIEQNTSDIWGADKECVHAIFEGGAIALESVVDIALVTFLGTPLYEMEQTPSLDPFRAPTTDTLPPDREQDEDS